MAGSSNKIYKIIVTEIRIKKQFIKIFTQDVHSAKYQELAHLKHLYNTSPPSHDPIKINDMCMAKVSNEIRRCHVLKIENGEIAVLYFIDCGFIGKLSCCELKLMPRDHFLFHAPSACEDFLLAHVIINDEIPDYRERMKKVYDLLLNRSYDMEIVGVAESLKFVKLSSNGFNLNLIQSDPMLRDVLKIVHVNDQIKKFIKTTESKPASKFEREIFPKSPETENMQEKQLFIIGSEHMVLVIAYVRGPYEFYVRFHDSIQKYKDFQQSLADIVLVPLQKPPVVGKNYLSVIETSSIDIFRVIVEDVEKDKVTVRFIDEGSEKIVSIDTLYEIPDETKSVPPYAFRFMLANLDSANHLDEDELDFYFRRSTLSRRLKLKIVAKNECSLYDPELNLSVREMLRDYDPRSLAYPEKRILKTENYKIHISNVDSAKCFHAQIINNTDSTLDFYEEFLKEYSSCQLKHPSLGNVCCVKFYDCFRRGKIIKRISPDLFRVLHVDYGCSMDYALNEIYAMVDTIVQDPPCAIKCQLLGDDDLNLQINGTDEKKEFYIKINYFDNGVYNVSILASYTSSYDDTSDSSISTSWASDQNEKNEVLMASVISPYDFTVHIYESLPHMEKFLEKLQVTASEAAKHPSSAVSEINVHEIYVMVNPKSSKWCRVSVYEIVNMGNQVIFSFSKINAHYPGTIKILNSDGLQMRNLDTGELLCVYDKKDVFIAPLEVKLKSFFGIRCSLPCIVETVNETAAAEFLNQYVGKAVSYRILASDQQVNIVELFGANDRNIVYKMMSLKLVKRLLIPPIGSAFVVHVINLKKFFIQLKHETPLLKLIKNYADTHYKHIPASYVLPDMKVMARFSLDGCWYRAKVLSSNNLKDENVKVQFIDFGNEDFVKISNIGSIPPQDLWLNNTPNLAKKCMLALPLGYDFKSKELISHFIKLANKGCTEFEYEMITGCLNCATISLYREYGKDILDELLSTPEEPLEEPEVANANANVVELDSEDIESLNDYIGFDTLENLCPQYFQEIVDGINIDDDELLRLLNSS